MFGEFLVRHIRLTRRNPTAHRDARLMHGFRITGNQWMPPGEVLSLCHQPIATRRRQPFQAPDVAWGEPHTILHSGMTMGIVAATAGPTVKQLAADVSEKRVVRILLDQFVEATAAAPVAE